MAIKTLTAFGGVRRIPGCARAGMKPNEIADRKTTRSLWFGMCGIVPGSDDVGLGGVEYGQAAGSRVTLKPRASSWRMWVRVLRSRLMRVVW
jgi:hypothetical protein